MLTSPVGRLSSTRAPSLGEGLQHRRNAEHPSPCHIGSVTFKGRAAAAQLALVNGAVGAVWTPGGPPRVVFGFTIAGGKIVAIDILADPARLDEVDLEVIND